ncbi:hypothetical protein F4810DRAFT_37777 [Camillea tinctor]|nr:hypothetical protein F4810DRAFT_37777 [Camillea tinctor]
MPAWSCSCSFVHLSTWTLYSISLADNTSSVFRRCRSLVCLAYYITVKATNMLLPYEIQYNSNMSKPIIGVKAMFQLKLKYNRTNKVKVKLA